MLATLLVLSAFILAGTFIEYRLEPTRICPDAYDVICMGPHQLVSLGFANIEPGPGSKLAKYHGKILGDRGLYMRFEMPRPIAAVFGGLLPLLAIIAALVLIFRHPGTSSRTTA